MASADSVESRAVTRALYVRRYLARQRRRRRQRRRSTRQGTERGKNSVRKGHDTRWGSFCPTMLQRETIVGGTEILPLSAREIESNGNLGPRKLRLPVPLFPSPVPVIRVRLQSLSFRGVPLSSLERSLKRAVLDWHVANGNRNRNRKS